MLIICLPSLLPVAERIAALHDATDGIKVAYVDVGAVYNEYSGGVPDPMAYRRVAFDYYMKGNKRLKNILLLGSLAADFRGVHVDRDPLSSLIAYQTQPSYLELEPKNANDAYACLDPAAGPADLTSKGMQVGIGVLPFTTCGDAEVYLEKLERFLKGDGMERMLNSSVIVTDVGDSHMHEEQGLRLSGTLADVSDSAMVQSVLCIDAYGVDAARKRFIDRINDGALLSCYIGHGAPDRVGSMKFLTSAQMDDIDGINHGIMLFAGCELTKSDAGVTGIGENMVLRNPGGPVGGLVASRDTWSNQNFDMMRKIVCSLFNSGAEADSPKRDVASTIGEVVMTAKNNHNYLNKLSYSYYGDPSIHMPYAGCSMRMAPATEEKVRPGSRVRLRCEVTDRAGNRMKKFNGKGMVKIAIAEKTYVSRGLVTGIDDGVTEFSVADDICKEQDAVVKDGVMYCDILVPTALASSSAEAVVYLSAYDSETRRGALGRGYIPLARYENSMEFGKDKSAPTIDGVDYDMARGILRFSVTDDFGLDAGADNGIKVRVGSREYDGRQIIIDCADGDGRRYECALPLYLPVGDNRLLFSITDANGNEAVDEREITVAPCEREISLRLIEAPVEDEAVFELSGDITGVSMVIEGNSGNRIAVLKAEGPVCRWIPEDASGLKLTPGLYRAYLIKEGEEAFRSEAVDIPLY